MANIQTVKPIAGQHFGNASRKVKALRAQLHVTRRELGRLRRLTPTKRIESMIDKLEQRECVIEETLFKD